MLLSADTRRNPRPYDNSLYSIVDSPLLWRLIRLCRSVRHFCNCPGAFWGQSTRDNLSVGSRDLLLLVPLHDTTLHLPVVHEPYRILAITAMRLSRVCLQAFQHHASSSSLSARSNSISFLGLGRMGSQMAFNLFSKHHALASETSFVVCDAVPETARSFTEDFRKRYPAVQISVVDTPSQ